MGAQGPVCWHVLFIAFSSMPFANIPGDISFCFLAVYIAPFLLFSAFILCIQMAQFARSGKKALLENRETEAGGDVITFCCDRKELKIEDAKGNFKVPNLVPIFVSPLRE